VAAGDQTRRDFLRTMGIVSASLFLPDFLHAQERSERPNIIYILADDLGYGEVGCYGQRKILTPNIDRLALEGMRFTDYYAGSTVCAPSRCSLLTGYHTGHTAIRGNREYFPEGQEPLPSGTMTIATLLKAAGYTTGVIGKWGLGGPGTSGVPNHQGFDYFFGYLCQRDAHDHYPWHLWRNQERVWLWGKEYSDDLFAREAVDFVRTNHSHPFFLYLAYTIPHYRLQVPDISPYAGKNWPSDMKKFAAMITRMDMHIGELMELIRQLGIDRNTLVIFSSDNGPHEEGGGNPIFFNSSGPFRGIKRDLYEGGIRVPMIAHWPGTIPDGQVTGQISAAWDVLPTCCDAAGITIPPVIDGISLMPTLLGQPRNQPQHAFLYWEFHEKGGRQAIRMGDWKAVRLGVSRNPEAPMELYDLKTDPQESHNIATSHPEVVAHLEELLQNSRTESSIFRLHQ
jgi:arylsulfatase A